MDALQQKLNRLKWLTIIMPALLVWGYETVRHTFLEDDLNMWAGNSIAALVVLLISYLFAQVTFAIISRMQMRLNEQNAKLKELNEQIEELAIIEERSRLSREFHDGLAQLLAYVMLKIDAIETMMRFGRISEAEAELELVRKACNDAYSDVREAITGLRPELFDGRNFLTILKELLDRFEDSNPLKIKLLTTGIEEDQVLRSLFPPVSTVQLSRVVQEALSNIRKHASASNITVKIEMDTDSNDPERPLKLTITDDGWGFSLDKIKRDEKHFGLIIMQERVESLGGNFIVDSFPDHGTTIQITLPVTVAISSHKL